VSCEECFLEEKVLCVIFGVCDNETVIIPVLRSVTGRRLVETENPNACATVNCKVCILAIALYCCMQVYKVCV
jgi:hypothetical protein